MPRKKKKSPAELLADAVVKGMVDKKAIQPVIMDFRGMRNMMCDMFVICHGTSRTHVESIADSVMFEAKKEVSAKPWHYEGFENAEWILIDYGDVVAHILQEDKRSFYNLEQLWADATIIKVDTKG